MEEKIYWIWLSRLKSVKSSIILNLLMKYKSPKVIFELTRPELLQMDDIGERIVSKILNRAIRKDLEKYLKYMNKHKIGILTIDDKDYPQKLLNIYDLPIVLYYKGNVKILNDNSIGIIGCRDNSKYGRDVAFNFAYKLSKQNINIVSGLARGIDSYAHWGCVKASGKTIAVIGNGLDDIYPSENQKLADEIVKNGGIVISEYIVGTKPTKYSFPARNRIISGLSDKLIVVEAKERSGTLITVDFALDQGKDVFAVPGNINNENSIGTNELIKHGASLINNINDVL